MNQTLENGKKNPNFGPDFGSLIVIHCFKLSLHVISRKTNEPNLKILAKNLASGPILAPLAQMLVPKIFFEDFTSTRHVRHCCKL